jgi:hypothetical protein
MLLQHEARTTSSNGSLRTAQATIKASRKLFSFFSDSVYSDKPVAIVRELTANAIDAMTMAGRGDTPVEIWLPTDLDPTFRCRDTGIGMSEDFIMTDYMSWANGSTKDDSDEVIGGFGIGKAAVFSYIDQYSLRSVHDGIVSVYSVYLNDDGIPTVAMMGQRQTNEPNGVEVSFPVKTDDFGIFSNAANTALKYFDPLPIVHNGDIDAPVYIARGKGWGMRDKAGPLNIIMGGVKYPVTTYNLPHDLRYGNRVSNLVEYGLDLIVPIGTCGVALSRESLSYNEKTNTGIEASLHAALDEIVNSFSTMFDQYPTEWDAKKALMLEISDQDSHYGRGKMVLDNAKYNGEPLTTDVMIRGDVWQIESRSNGRRRAQGKCPSAKWEYTNYGYRFDRFEKVIIDDLPQENKSRTIQRIKTYVDEDCYRSKPILVLRNYKFDIDVPTSEFVFTSSLPEPEKIVRTKTERPRVRMFQAVDGDWPNNVRPEKYRDRTEIAYADQPDSGILVVCENFEVSHSLRQKHDAGLISISDVRFVNTSDAVKLKADKWPRYEDVFAKRLAEVAHPDLSLAMTFYNDQNLNNLFYLTKFVNLDDVKVTKRTTPIAKVIGLHRKYVAPLTREQRLLAQFLPVPDNKINTLTLMDAVKTKQPKAYRLLKLINDPIKPDTFDYNFVLENF